MALLKRSWIQANVDELLNPTPKSVGRVHVFDGDDPSYESKTQTCIRCQKLFIVNHKRQASPEHDKFVLLPRLDSYIMPSGFDWCLKSSSSGFAI